jgi:hypothetical protein
MSYRDAYIAERTLELQAEIYDANRGMERHLHAISEEPRSRASRLPRRFLSQSGRLLIALGGWLAQRQTASQSRATGGY